MSEQPHTSEQPLDVFVSLSEAARTYDTSADALRARARADTLRAYKVAGLHGREWRVSLRSLEAAGFQPRVPVAACVEERARVLELEAELLVMQRLLAGERRRADRADQELGHALLESGRLRSQLNRAHDSGATSADQLSVSAGSGPPRLGDGHDLPEQR